MSALVDLSLERYLSTRSVMLFKIITNRNRQFTVIKTYYLFLDKIVVSIKTLTHRKTVLVIHVELTLPAANMRG